MRAVIFFSFKLKIDTHTRRDRGGFHVTQWLAEDPRALRSSLDTQDHHSCPGDGGNPGTLVGFEQTVPMSDLADRPCDREMSSIHL